MMYEDCENGRLKVFTLMRHNSEGKKELGLELVIKDDDKLISLKRYDMSKEEVLDLLHGLMKYAMQKWPHDDEVRDFIRHYGGSVTGEESKEALREMMSRDLATALAVMSELLQREQRLRDDKDVHGWVFKLCEQE